MMERYEELLAAAQADPLQADYHALRMAFARSDAYQPYARDAQLVARMYDALRADELGEALAAIERLLEQNPLDVEAHLAAHSTYAQRGNSERAAYHRAFGAGLLDAIIRSGDGRSFATAYVVLDIAEEYLVLRLRGLRAAMQALLHHEDHWYDMIKIEPPTPDGDDRVYFNIDLLRPMTGQS